MPNATRELGIAVREQLGGEERESRLTRVVASAAVVRSRRDARVAFHRLGCRVGEWDQGSARLHRLLVDPAVAGISGNVVHSEGDQIR